MKPRYPSILVIVAAVAMLPMLAFGAGDRSLSLNPNTGAVDQPGKFLAGNGLLFDLAKGGINAKTTAATNIAKLKATGDATSFYCTQIKVETTAATAITGGASITVGSTGTAANSLLATQALANTPVVNGYETFVPKAGALVVGAGDTLTVTVGTGATGTSQTVKVHVIGYYQ